MSKPMTNAAYRKLRGTEKPFNGSDENAKALWAELIRREKWTSAKGIPATDPTRAK